MLMRQALDTDNDTPSAAEDSIQYSQSIVQSASDCNIHMYHEQHHSWKELRKSPFPQSNCIAAGASMCLSVANLILLGLALIRFP